MTYIQTQKCILKNLTMWVMNTKEGRDKNLNLPLKNADVCSKNRTKSAGCVCFDLR